MLALGVAATIGTVLAANAGEGLEEKLRAMGEANTWEEHAEAGETAQVVAIGVGIGSVATVVNAGHSGAKSVWEEVQSGDGG